VARWGQRRGLEVAGRTAALGATWAVVYGAMLAAYGVREYYCEVVMWRLNLSSWVPTLHVLLLFGVMWALAFAGAKRGPRMLARALWLLPPYVVLHYVVAMVQEARLFLPFAPVIIPLSWWVLFPEARLGERGPREGEATSRRGVKAGSGEWWRV